MPQAPDAPLVARYARKRSEQGAYVFVTVLVLGLVYMWWSAEPGDFVIGMIAFAVILVVLHFEQRRIQNSPGPQLIIDEAGLVMPEHFVHRLPWQAITSARVVRPHERTDLLVLDIPEPSPYGPRGNHWDRRLREFGGGTEFMIGIGDLDVDSTQIEAAIARFAPGKANPPA